jgi:hypothetical protein
MKERRYHTMPGRMTELMNKAADEFERGTNPFESWWLSENNVSLDECMALSESTAIALRHFAAMTLHQQALAIMKWAKEQP